VKSADHTKGNYRVEELDGTEFRSSVTGDRLKKFYLREEEGLREAGMSRAEDESEPIEEESEEEHRKEAWQEPSDNPVSEETEDL
jgi:hypothetical protein